MKKGMIFLMALVMASITTYLFYTYMQGTKPEAATATTQTADVVVAKVEIKKDTQITDQMVTVTQVPQNAVQPGAIQSSQVAVGKFATVDIHPNEMILAHHIEIPGDAKYLSYKIKPGFRAVTVTASSVGKTVANLIEPGDYVDIVLTKNGKTSVLLKKVNVLSVDRRMKQASEKDPYNPYSMVTLEVSPENALKLVDSEQKGIITFDLYSAIGSSEED